MSDLGEVAFEYEYEAMRALSRRKSRRLRAMAASLRDIVDNRAGADPTTLLLHPDVPPDVPGRWCRQHGYTAGLGADGLTVRRDGEPPAVARLGDTLRWDGRRIHVEPRARGEHVEPPA
ncbi:hypothetical protein [Streptomyces sp. NPDC058108]|uniref:hypothetical protein n=1 Tax=Streptomyces sp. NPDC058108 TaxID=3346344 RepID=UPI0036DFF532